MKKNLMVVAVIGIAFFGIPGAEAASIQLAQVSEANPAALFNQILRFLFLTAGLLAFGMVVYGGVKYTLSAGNIASTADARDQIVQALVGLLLLIGGSTILFTINPSLLNTPIPTLAPVEAVKPPTPRPPYEVPPYQRGLSDTVARGQLTAVGVGIKSGVSLEGVQQAVVDELVRLKQECHCEITVTAGSDGVHLPGACSHANGWKVDLRLNADLNGYIENSGSFRYSGSRSDDHAELYERGAAVYAKENDHWDLKLSCI